MQAPAYALSLNYAGFSTSSAVLPFFASSTDAGKRGSEKLTGVVPHGHQFGFKQLSSTLSNMHTNLSAPNVLLRRALTIQSKIVRMVAIARHSPGPH